MSKPIDWSLFKFGSPANRRYKILLPRTQLEIVELENDLSIPALWQATIAELTKTYPPELAPVAKPFCQLRSTAHLCDGTPISIAMSGAIAPVESTHQLRAAYGHWVVVAVPPEAINELTADLHQARHDPSCNLAGIAFTGAHLVSTGADCTLQKVRECPRTTKLLVAPHPPDPPEKPWLWSASEQALLDHALGSLKEAFAKDRKALTKAREWRIGRTDITRHRRAKPFEAFLSQEGPYRTIRRLEKALQDYGYPHTAERLLTPAAFRHLKWLWKEHDRQQANLRQQRLRAVRAELPAAILP
jgi:hypothetical protein